MSAVVEGRAVALGRLVTPWHAQHGWGLADFGLEVNGEGGTWHVTLMGPIKTDCERPRFWGSDQPYGKRRIRLIVGTHGTILASSFEELTEAASEWLRAVGGPSD